jgi:nucleotide-binding universal stress UspA family protein
MQTIIAPTDFSAISLNAVNYAADLATVISTKLTLIHVYTLPMAFSEVPVSAYSVEQLETDAEEQMKQLKEKISERSGGRLTIDTILREGDVLFEIEKYCESVNPYAVVMGAESASAFERFLLGRKTIAAMNHITWPIIVVPPDAKFKSIRKIGLACDFRKVVDTIPFKEIKSLVKDTKAELHVLHVSTETGADYSAETIEESGWLQEILDELKPKYDFIKGKDIEAKLGEFAEKNNLDLLIVIPKKHDLLGKLFQQSHSRNLVLHTHVPVMSIHE